MYHYFELYPKKKKVKWKIRTTKVIERQARHYKNVIWEAMKYSDHSHSTLFYFFFKFLFFSFHLVLKAENSILLHYLRVSHLTKLLYLPNCKFNSSNFFLP